LCVCTAMAPGVTIGTFNTNNNSISSSSSGGGGGGGGVVVVVVVVVVLMLKELWYLDAVGGQIII